MRWSLAFSFGRSQCRTSTLVGQSTLPLAETVVMSNPPSCRSEISLYLELTTPCARENFFMPPLPDARHERFAQLVADKHMSNAEAYRRAVDKPGMKPEVAASMADKWLKRVDISDRIAELRAQAEAAARLSREQLVEFLSKIITAQPCDAAPDNPHCELLAGGKIGFPSKLQAASQLARMCGWDAPQKVNIEAGDSLSVFLREIVTR